MKKTINVDKVLNDIKRSNRASKIIITNCKEWDILDGRTRKGRPFKKFARAVDIGMYLLACATLSFLLVYFFFQWVA